MHKAASDISSKVGGHRLGRRRTDRQGRHQQWARRRRELLAASLVSCTAITMQLYAERKGWKPDDLTVEVEWQPAERVLRRSSRWCSGCRMA